MSVPKTVPNFTEFYLSYRPKLTGLLMRMLRRRRDDVEDVLQEVWIRGAKAWPPRDPALARAWLGRIAINEALSRRRRSRRSPLAESALVDAASWDAPDPRPAADEEVLRREVHRAIDRLEAHGPRQAAVVRLVCIKGFTYVEAARELGIAEGTAKSQTFKAIEHLRASLTAPKAA